MSAKTNVRQSTDVTVDVATRSVTYITNTVFQMLFRIASRRGLSPAYINEQREVIENGLFVWLGEQTLRRAYLEVFLPGDNHALEQWEFRFSYVTDFETGSKQPPVAELAELCERLNTLPRSAEYRIVVQTEPGATEVPGWSPTRLRSMGPSQTQELQAWGYGNIQAGLTFRGGR